LHVNDLLLRLDILPSKDTIAQYQAKHPQRRNVYDGKR
jgi:hypothetical protein